MFDNCEFVIERSKKNIVVQCKARIEHLFDVDVSFLANGNVSDGMLLWLSIKGDDTRTHKAKDYIKALTSPQENSAVVIPAALVPRLRSGSNEHTKLEAEYAVVIRFPQATQAVISGNDVAVTLAASKLEDLKSSLEKPAPSVSANRRSLEEFALKLGYEQNDITAVFDKLGPEVDRNTFLNELIKISKPKTRPAEDRRSPIPTTIGTRGTFNRDAFARYSGEMSKGVATSAMSTHDNINARGFVPQENHGIVARGCIRAPQSSSTVSYAATHRESNGIYNMPSNNYKQGGCELRDANQEEQMFQQLLRNGCRYQQFPQSDLRHIVIDGSNVAMSHGNNKVFSCKGIALCVDWFRQRGHTQITVFVPQWRKESAKAESPITDQYYLYQLEEQGYLTFTPSRRVNGRRIVCYDDRFVVRLAENTDGIIVSNDNFKDLAQENPKWKEVIERKLLMYSFVNDMFMPPDDPLGRHGPTLDEFLHKGTPTQRRPCPYGRRCTYGTRCKYHHPEREDKRLQVYQVLKEMFPSQDALIVSVMRKFPQERDPEKLAIHILDMSE